MKKYIFLLFVAAVNLTAATRIVSRDHYTTIQSAIDAAGSGDVVQIESGIYHELIDIYGKTDLLIRGAPNANVIIEGAYADVQVAGNTLWTKDDEHDGLYYCNTPFVKKDMFVCKGDDYNYHWCSLSDGTMLYPYKFEHRHTTPAYKNASYTYCHDTSATYPVFVRIGHPEPVNPRNIAINIPTGIVIDITNSSRIHLKNIEVRNGFPIGIYLRGDSVNGVTIDDVSVINCARGISSEWKIEDTVKSHDITIINTRVKNGFPNKNIKNRNMELWDRGYMNHCANIRVYSKNLSIHNCLIDGGWDGIAGIGENAEIYHTTIRNIHDDALQLKAPGNTAKNVHIHQNIIDDCFVGVSLTAGDGPIYLYRNVIIADQNGDDDSRAYAFKLGTRNGQNSRNWHMYHNTVYANGKIISADASDTDDLSKVENWNMYYNIFTSSGKLFGSKHRDFIAYSGLKDNDITYDANCWFQWRKRKTDKFCNNTNGNDVAYTIDDFRKHSSNKWEQHGFWKSPKFTGKKDRPDGLHLSSKSPCIDPDIEVDLIFPDTLFNYNGEIIEQNADDIGCYDNNVSFPVGCNMRFFEE